MEQSKRWVFAKFASPHQRTTLPLFLPGEGGRGEEVKKSGSKVPPLFHYYQTYFDTSNAYFESQVWSLMSSLPAYWLWMAAL